jgi:hypothetical protein
MAKHCVRIPPGIGQWDPDLIGVQAPNGVVPLEPLILSLPPRMPSPALPVPVAPVRTAPIDREILKVFGENGVTDIGSIPRNGAPAVFKRKDPPSANGIPGRLPSAATYGHRPSMQAKLFADERRRAESIGPGFFSPRRPDPSAITRPKNISARKVSISPNELPCPPGYMRLSHV